MSEAPTELQRLIAEELTEGEEALLLAFLVKNYKRLALAATDEELHCHNALGEIIDKLFYGVLIHG